MKTTFLILLAIVSTAFAGLTDEPLKLASEMQEAILRTQDVHKVDNLLARGADINAPIGCGTYGVLDGAVQTENLEMLKYLLAHGAKPHGRELALAAFARRDRQALEMVKVLLTAGVGPNTRDGDSTPLMWAAYRGNTDLIRLLLSQPGIKLDEMNADGYTALMTAVKHGESEIVDLLIQAGASVAIANERGETAATVAREKIEKQQAILAKLGAGAKVP